MLPHCVLPNNPDAIAVGGRFVLYSQTFVIVILSVLFTFKRTGTSPESFSAMWNLQLYTTLAIAIAVAIQCIRGELSLFHQFVAFNLGFLSVYAGTLGFLCGMAPQVEISNTDNNMRSMGSPACLSRFQENFHVLIQLGWSIFVGLTLAMVVSLSVGCEGNVDVDSSPEELVWWIFGVRVKLIHSPYLPLAIPVGALMLHNILSLLLKFCLPRWNANVRFTVVIRISFAFVYTIVVGGIERSIIITGLAISEDQWSFGQLIPLILLIPLLENMWKTIRSTDLLSIYTARGRRRRFGGGGGTGSSLRGADGGDSSDLEMQR